VLRVAWLLLAGLLALRGQAAPQIPAEADSAGLLRASDLVVAGSLLAAQLGLLALDDDIRDAALGMRNEATNDVASAFRPLGRKPPWLYASVAAYAVGKLVDEPRVADVALHALVSFTLANAITGGLKGLGGRFRPSALQVSGADSVWVAHEPDEWRLLAGWRDGGPRQSWPSGHTTAAFAIAAAISEELGGAAPWIAYPLATGVAWSRVHDGAHWATDVLMGALVGTVTARLVVRYGHSRGSWLERTLLLERDPHTRGVHVGARLPAG
jgi:membrane-associated phospholipid phosphatase